MNNEQDELNSIAILILQKETYKYFIIQFDYDQDVKKRFLNMKLSLIFSRGIIVALSHSFGF